MQQQQQQQQHMQQQHMQQQAGTSVQQTNSADNPATPWVIYAEERAHYVQRFDSLPLVIVHVSAHTAYRRLPPPTTAHSHNVHLPTPVHGLVHSSVQLLTTARGAAGRVGPHARCGLQHLQGVEPPAGHAGAQPFSHTTPCAASVCVEGVGGWESISAVRWPAVAHRHGSGGRFRGFNSGHSLLRLLTGAPVSAVRAIQAKVWDVSSYKQSGNFSQSEFVVGVWGHPAVGG